MNARGLYEQADEIVAQLDKSARSNGHDVSDEPRIPAGNGRKSGEWTASGETESGRTKVRRLTVPHDDFFDLMGPVANKMAQDLQIPSSWILGLSAYESGWMGPHARDFNNPFGLTNAGKNNLHFDSVDSAAQFWEGQYGNEVYGATSPEDFVQRLQDTKTHGAYNTVNPNWSHDVLGTIRAVQQRQSVRDGSW